MKATKEITGLRIISISDGMQVGQVKDFVLNPKSGSLEFFIIDKTADYFGAKVIAFSDILGLGEFAVTIPGLQVIQDVAQNSAVQELLKQNVKVIGTKVLTKKGQLIGEVKEIFIDEETGKIAFCAFTDSSGETREVSADHIITYGKELLIIESEPEEKMAVQKNEDISALSEVTQDPSSFTTEASGETETGFNLFEQRQLQYFVGKTVEKDITLDNGEILSAGEPMTEDVIRKITTRSTLMEITSYLNKH